MAQNLDFRVHAQANFEISVYSTNRDHVVISIAEPDGIGIEAVLTRAQAEQLPEDLRVEVDRARDG